MDSRSAPPASWAAAARSCAESSPESRQSVATVPWVICGIHCATSCAWIALFRKKYCSAKALKSVVAAGHAMQQDGRCGVRGLESDDTEEEQARRHDQ